MINHRRRKGFVLLLALAAAGCGGDEPGREGGEEEPVSPPAQESPGVGLRRMVLTTAASDLGFAADAEFPRVYGVLMDWDVGDATVSVMSMRDGAASLYSTASFGVIGGQGHESVGAAAVRFVNLAESYVDSGDAVTEYPYPESGTVNFYLLTYEGVRLCVGNEAAMKSGADETRALFDAAQDVLTQLRLSTQGGGTKDDRGPGEGAARP